MNTNLPNKYYVSVYKQITALGLPYFRNTQPVYKNQDVEA
jgi:hypothetical protein